MAKHFTKAQLIDAVKGSGGIISEVARRLNCDWLTAKKYIDKSDAAKKLLKCEEEAMLDTVEQCAYDIAASGDGRMVRYILSTKGKSRGWSETIDAPNEARDPVIQIVLPSNEGYLDKD